MSNVDVHSAEVFNADVTQQTERVAGKMDSNLWGRLRNTPLPFTSALLPLLEAVVNAIHACEELGLSSDDGKIDIEIIREPKQKSLNLDFKRKPGPEARDDISGFRVTDNGVGFNDDNMKSFSTLDSDYKAKKGCRGIGRLLWLKAFQHVTVSSVYEADGIMYNRSFEFTPKVGISTPQNVSLPANAIRRTTVTLKGFNARYRQYAKKTPEAIADVIVEHCLWYFIREGSAPIINLIDGEETVSVQDAFDRHVVTSVIPDRVEIKEQEFELLHVRLRSTSASTHCIALCADNRLVMEEKLAGKLPGLHGKLADENGEFFYSCYVSSPFLDEYARPERTGFDIAESVEDLFENTEISLSDIRQAIIDKAKAHLGDHLAQNVARSKERITEFVSKKGLRYRPILGRIPDDQLAIDPSISETELELFLHKHLATLERQLLEQGSEVMAHIDADDFERYEKRLQQYLEMAAELKASDLAGYVSHRRTIIDLFEKAIQVDNNTGSYAREDLIHKLIIPMQVESDGILSENCNLWILDERLAFHNYLASDKPLCSQPISSSDETKEPDLCALNVFDRSLLVAEGAKVPLASIVIVEIKRPMRNDARPGEAHDPIEQAIGYLSRIRAGEVKTSGGRPIPQSEDIPGFIYVLADLTPSFKKRCQDHHDLKRTADGCGYFGYKDNLKSYIEVFSFDRLVNSAKERNRAFFDKLGLPSN